MQNTKKKQGLKQVLKTKLSEFVFISGLKILHQFQGYKCRKQKFIVCLSRVNKEEYKSFI